MKPCVFYKYKVFEIYGVIKWHRLMKHYVLLSNATYINHNVNQKLLTTSSFSLTCQNPTKKVGFGLIKLVRLMLQLSIVEYSPAGTALVFNTKKPKKIDYWYIIFSHLIKLYI